MKLGIRTFWRNTWVTACLVATLKPLIELSASGSGNHEQRYDQAPGLSLLDDREFELALLIWLHLGFFRPEHAPRTSPNGDPEVTLGRHASDLAADRWIRTDLSVLLWLV